MTRDFPHLDHSAIYLRLLVGPDILLFLNIPETFLLLPVLHSDYFRIHLQNLAGRRDVVWRPVVGVGNVVDGLIPKGRDRGPLSESPQVSHHDSLLSTLMEYTYIPNAFHDISCCTRRLPVFASDAC